MHEEEDLNQDDNDIYSEQARDRMIEDEEITDEDAGVMQGYSAA